MAEEDHDTDQIKTWQSITTLVVFVIANILVLFPFHIPVYVPHALWDIGLDALSALRITPPRRDHRQNGSEAAGTGKVKPYVRLSFPVNLVTAPLIADLFLLAITAIGREEVYGGTIGTHSIFPVDIMVFFITLAYIAISIDASGLIRYLAFKVLQWGGKAGHRLFFYLYAFFFVMGSFIGNDPIILSGTAFLAYMTRVSSNIVNPRAWIYTQFAIANIASAILVSSNPANLVLAGAFEIKFIEYTANMIVPVVFTAIILLPFLLYIVFANESLIPVSIKMHELPEEAKGKKPVNPNIPYARGNMEEEEESSVANDEQTKLSSLEEIMNPFLDKRGAAFGSVIMAVTLITVLALNAANTSGEEQPVFWVTLPAAFVMLCWDLGFGWYYRHETREIARKGRREVEYARVKRTIQAEDEAKRVALIPDMTSFPVESGSTLTKEHLQRARIQSQGGTDTEKDNTADENEDITPAVDGSGTKPLDSDRFIPPTLAVQVFEGVDGVTPGSSAPFELSDSALTPRGGQLQSDRPSSARSASSEKAKVSSIGSDNLPQGVLRRPSDREMDEKKEETDLERRILLQLELQRAPQPLTLVLFIKNADRWLRETFPTVMAVMGHLPFALVPFAFAMFVLVQGLVTKGWVQVFARGWDHWVEKTGTVGSIGGMGFLSVILSNFAGTNIGTAILLSRMVQEWQDIHRLNEIPISDRTFWATVYSMAIGVNYGAFSTAFSASLAGLLWRDILARKHIQVRSLDFARVNLPIITISMIVGCAVLIGEVYIMRDNSPYDS